MADASLTAVFGGNTVPLEQACKRAASSVADFTSRAAKNGFGDLLGPIAKVAAAVGSVGAVMSGLKGALDLGGEMVDLANRTGLAVESAYGLRQAFKDAGVDANALGPAVNKMQKSLASAVSGGKEGDALKALGLDPQALASMDPGKAFAQIGNAIAQLPNATERAAASMAIFGKSGAELLQVFMDPSFKDAGNISNTARLLGENAASFDRASDALGKSGSKITGFFVGVGSQVVPQLNAAVAAFEKLDLSASGQNVGGIISVAIQSIVQGRLGELIWLDLKVAFENAINFLAAGLYALFGSIGSQAALFGTVVLEPFAVLNETSFWTGLVDTFMSLVNLFNAKLLDGVAGMIGALRNVPLVGDQIGAGADKVQSVANSFRAQSVAQSLSGGDALGRVAAGSRARISEAANYFFSDFKQKFGSVDIFGQGDQQQLQELINTLYDAGSAANQAGRMENQGRVAPQGAFNGADIGQAAKASIIADSLSKVGGGGFSVGPGSNPILEENKRQTAYLASINQGILRAAAASGPLEAQFK
jgi:hypothetical protein